MNDDIAPIEKIVKLAKKYNALTFHKISEYYNEYYIEFKIFSKLLNFLSFSDRRLLPQKCEGVKHQF
nr:hypothetical protein [Bacillus sp. AY18-3]